MNEITKTLTKDDIAGIVQNAVAKNAWNMYEARMDVQILMDALRVRGTSLNNEFQVNSEKIPVGTYEFLYERDLGSPIGKCECFGCGHPIRFEQHIRHRESNKTMVVGSTCLKNILGQHPLLDVIADLESRISEHVDNLNKAEKIKRMLGDIPARIRSIDPERRITQSVQRFFDQVESASNGINISTAKEIAATWNDSAFAALSNNMQELTEHNNRTKEIARERIRSWNAFLYYKQWDNKRRNHHSDFILNCIEDLKVHDDISPERKSALMGEKELYDRVKQRDITLLKYFTDAEQIKYLVHMLIHLQKCDSYFFTSVIMQAVTTTYLSPGQIEAIDRGCGKCNQNIFIL